MKSAYLDGELCALNGDGVPVFSRLQAAMDEGRTDQLVFFAFDLLFLNGVSTGKLPLIKRKERLQRLFKKEFSELRYSEHVAGDGPAFRAQACKLGLEDAISKQADRPYAPGDRGIWVKSKCLNREEFVVVGWTDPEGSRSHIGALLLGYYTDDSRLHYAGRAGTGMNEKELKRLGGVLAPLQVPKMPLAEPPPRDSRFGSPLVHPYERKVVAVSPRVAPSPIPHRTAVLRCERQSILLQFVRTDSDLRRQPQSRVSHSRSISYFEFAVRRRATPSGSETRSRFAFPHSPPSKGTARRPHTICRKLSAPTWMCRSDLVATTTRPPKWNQAERARLAEEAPTVNERGTIPSTKATACTLEATARRLSR